MVHNVIFSTKIINWEWIHSSWLYKLHHSYARYIYIYFCIALSAIFIECRELSEDFGTEGFSKDYDVTRTEDNYKRTMTTENMTKRAIIDIKNVLFVRLN